MDKQTQESSGGTIAGPRAVRDVTWVFFEQGQSQSGHRRLRAGWGVLLFLLVFSLSFTLIRWALDPLMRSLGPSPADPSSPSQPVSPAYGFLLQMVQGSGAIIATVFMALLERRPVFAYGYQGNARVVRFFSGLALGFVAISAFILFLSKAGALSLDGLALHGAAAWKYAFEWGLLFLVVAIFEESTLRGYLQYTLARGLGFWWGAFLLSLVFGFGHGSNTGETPAGLFSAAAVGLVFCLSLWYTGSLWWAIGFHAAWDWGQSYVYGTADSGLAVQGHLFSEHPVGRILWSGGSTGPEGSLFIFPLLFVIAVVMWLWWGRLGPSPFWKADRQPPLPRLR